MFRRNSKVKTVATHVASGVRRFLNSSALTWSIIGIFALQSLWFAISFDYGMVFDEDYHFGIIVAYTEQLGPIIYDQPRELDSLRDLENETSFLYHYLLSFPLRLVALFTNDTIAQIVALRTVNVLFVVLALFVYFKLFKALGYKSLYGNIGLLIFVSIPIFPYISATVNYDNLLLLVTGLYLFTFVRYLQGWPWNMVALTQVITLGILGSLVKFTFLPVFTVSVLALAVYLYRHRSKFDKKRLHRSIVSTSLTTKSFLVILFISVSSLFTMIYVKNVVVYGTPQPSCTETLGKERCASSPIVKRGDMLNATKDERQPVLLYEYASIWITSMLEHSSLVRATNEGAIDRRPDSLPIISNAIFFGAFASLFAVLLKWNRHWGTKEHRFVWIIIAVVIGSVFMKTASGYYTHYSPVAIQPRYMLTIAPLLIVFAVASFGYILSRHRLIGAIGLVIVLFTLTQGGGMTSYLVRSNPTWFHDSEKIRDFNTSMQSIAKPLVREYPGKYGF